MDAHDLAILKRIQREFPATPRPYRALAQELGLTEDEVFRRVSALRRAGVIRRIGPLFSARKLGFRGRLAAARVDAAAVDAVAERLAAQGAVTHNYLRDGALNVWFTVTVKTDAALEALLDEVRSVPGVRELHVFETERLYKLDASFRFGDNGDD